MHEQTIRNILKDHKQRWLVIQPKDHGSSGGIREDRIIPHPPQSPDFNVLEDMWSYLDRKVKAAKLKQYMD